MAGALEVGAAFDQEVGGAGGARGPLRLVFGDEAGEEFFLVFLGQRLADLRAGTSDKVLTFARLIFTGSIRRKFFSYSNGPASSPMALPKTAFFRGRL